MDLKNFISTDALCLLFKLNGWSAPKTIEIENLGIFKPDFYETGHVLVASNKAIIQAKGHTIVKYKNKTYEDVASLLKELGNVAVFDFKNWAFEVEKEWVLFKDGEWMTSFTTLDKLPKRTKFRC